MAVFKETEANEWCKLNYPAEYNMVVTATHRNMNTHEIRLVNEAIWAMSLGYTFSKLCCIKDFVPKPTSETILNECKEYMKYAPKFELKSL